MSAKFRSLLTLILKIAFAVALIFYLVHSGHLDLNSVWNLITPLNVTVALVLVGLNLLASTWRWLILLRARGMKVPSGYGFGLYLIGTFFNYALPGAVSGDLVRGFYLVQDYPGHKMDSALSVLIDRILGLYCFFLLTLIGVAADLPFAMGHPQIRWVATLAGVLFVGMTVFFLLGFSSRLYARSGVKWIIEKIGPLHRLMEGFQRFGQHRSAILKSVLISLLAQFVALLFFYAVALQTGEAAITWRAILFAVPMGFVVTAVPIAPAGVGVGQVAFLYLFRTYLGRATPIGAIAITAFQLANAAWALVGALIYVRRRKPHELDHLDSKMESAAT